MHPWMRKPLRATSPPISIYNRHGTMSDNGTIRSSSVIPKSGRPIFRNFNQVGFLRGAWTRIFVCTIGTNADWVNRSWSISARKAMFVQRLCSVRSQKYSSQVLMEGLHLNSPRLGLQNIPKHSVWSRLSRCGVADILIRMDRPTPEIRRGQSRIISTRTS